MAVMDERATMAKKLKTSTGAAVTDAELKKLLGQNKKSKIKGKIKKVLKKSLPGVAVGKGAAKIAAKELAKGAVLGGLAGKKLLSMKKRAGE